jgi:hypothetical protein
MVSPVSPGGGWRDYRSVVPVAGLRLFELPQALAVPVQLVFDLFETSKYSQDRTRDHIDDSAVPRVEGLDFAALGGEVDHVAGLPRLRMASAALPSEKFSARLSRPPAGQRTIRSGTEVMHRTQQWSARLGLGVLE